MNKTQLAKIVSQIRYNGWEFRLHKKGDGFLLQVVFYAWDNDSPKKTGQLYATKQTEQKCRKWYISSHSTAQEVVRTAFKAVQAAVEHELCEQFLYNGHAIYNPHISHAALIDASKKQVYRK